MWGKGEGGVNKSKGEGEVVYTYSLNYLARIVGWLGGRGPRKAERMIDNHQQLGVRGVGSRFSG